MALSLWKSGSLFSLSQANRFVDLELLRQAGSAACRSPAWMNFWRSAAFPLARQVSAKHYSLYDLSRNRPSVLLVTSVHTSTRQRLKVSPARLATINKAHKRGALAVIEIGGTAIVEFVSKAPHLKLVPVVA
jgi:hypothetical protein